MATIFLAGYPIPDRDVLELARLVGDPDLANRLEGAYSREARIVALEINDRELILRALEGARRPAWRTSRGTRRPRARRVGVDAGGGR